MEVFDDDDFGELYAIDIEVPNAFPEDYDEDEEKLDANSNIVNRDQDVNDEYCATESDSDDDGLNIVLNDEDVPAGVDDYNDDDDGDAADDINASRFFHPKSGRSRGLSILDKVKASASMGMASYISSLNRGRRNGDSCIQSLALRSSRVCLAANPMAVQCGYGSVLPWYWGIFDVNIDTLTEKPWKVPGVDITDYFNFGFNESTWKLYCTSLEQLWRTALQSGFSVGDSANWNQEAMREQTDQVGSGNVLFPSSDYGLPKGRAIQVEDSMVERQPSIDVRRPRNRDFNVIEIKLLESSDDYSGSGNSTVMDASLEGESMAGNKRNILNSSSERNEMLSEDRLEDVQKAVDSSVQRRSGPISGVDGDEHWDQAGQHSEDTAEVPEGEVKAEEGGGIDACSSYPCLIESELSLGDQEHSLTSYTGSDSEATDTSVHVDNDKSVSPLTRKSLPLNHVTDTKESSPLNWKNSKNNSINTKAVSVTYNSKTRGQFRKEWRHQSGGYEPSSYGVNKHTENENGRHKEEVFLARRPVDYRRHKDQLQFFGSHKRDVSYNRETKQSYYYGGEKVVDELVARHSEYYHEDRESFRENTNLYDRKNGDVGDYFFEPGPRYADSEDRERNWYNLGCGFSSDDLSPCSYRESRQFLPNHSSFPDKERYAQRKRMDEKSHFIDRNCIDDFDECEFEFLNKSYRMSTVAEREMEFVDNNHEEQFPHIDRDWERSVRRGIHFDSPPLILNKLCSEMMEVKDNCQKYTHYQTSNFMYRRQSYTDSVKNYAFGARVNGNFGGYRRDKHARDNKGSNWSCDYADTAEDEDFPIYPVKEYQFYRSPSKFLNWKEDEIICSRHEAHETSLFAKVQSDGMSLQRHQLSMPKRDSEKYFKGSSFKGSSRIKCRSKGGQAVLRYRKSVDLINGEGKVKSQVRSSRVLCNGRLENINQGIAKKRRRASVGFDESNKNASKVDTLKHKSNHVSKKWVQNLEDQRQKESSDIEEGQIVAEESYMEEASLSRRDASTGPVVNKKRMSENENSSEQCIGGYDSQRILDSLAKMEKRRERFKQPIAMKKEAEKCLKLNNDSIADTGEMKQHRPARKRRWVGN